MIRAVLYLRSSKDRADVSIDAQRRSLHELAQARSILIVGEYADAVESGKDDDRQGFQNLIRDLRSPDRSWDHVIALDTARVARRRALAIIFEEHECKRRGVRVIYKSLPESDPITEMLLKSILQAMDEWHSLTSRVKGLAGMAENVRQGWRAGGRAARGYRLQYHDTGAIRDGVAVTKSKLVPGDDALQVRSYLQHRAKGVKRSRALEIAGAEWPASSLIDMERNALLYAGHTIWNRHAERMDGKYVGGEKIRPRSEWVIQNDTHEALITESEAEAILSSLEEKKRSGGQPARRTYLLSGILTSSDGKLWNGDGGSYRLGKGPRISAEAVERAVIERIFSDLQSDTMVNALLKHYRSAAAAETKPEDIGVKKRRMTEIDKKTSRLADLMTETTAPGALLRQIEELETEREKLVDDIESFEESQRSAKAMREISASDIKRMLRGVAADLGESDPEALRDGIFRFVKQIKLSEDSFNAHILYHLPVETGVLLASPRRPVSFPCFEYGPPIQIGHNKRRA